jgi:FlaA1/EpsC-like NDP-sugar epimerase
MNPFPGLRWLSRTERWSGLHRSAVWLAQCCIFVLAGVAAFLLRFEFTIPDVHRKHLLCGLLIWAAVKLVVFRLLGLDRGWWRFVSVHDLARLAAGNIATSVLAASLIVLLGPPGFPRSLYILDLVLCFLATSGIRLAVKLFLDSLGRGAEYAVGKRIFIYGAGMAGVTLLREIRSNKRLSYAICGFIDDNPHKRGIRIQGVRVVGSGADLNGLVPRHTVSEVLIALPSASGAEITIILNRCQAAGVRCRTIPALAETIEGRGLASQIRDVAVEDLLGRTPATLEHGHISAKLQGRIVLVTGAGGSIGSELCRQIGRFQPAAIVAYDNAESPLFQIEQEMIRMFPDVTFHPVIGSIQNTRRLSDVFTLYQPDIVYHAAAYKHVPMMEAHSFEAVENNVLGTLNLALAADRHGAADFVMISSDKAVCPANIMGATKRLTELVIRSLQNGSTKFVSVRFGNVLGSNGSVVPIFKAQIARGGPVTVTHPDMRRFFMTIPEACQLVLQSSTMGKGGEIFVLDMGDPVRIVDLARNLILLSGLRPGEDIKIEFTGIRPGEKLFEELSTYDENTLPTHHEKIKIFAGTTIPWPLMEKYLDQIRSACNARNLDDLVLTLKDLIPEYNPSATLLRRVLHSKPLSLAATSSRAE